jgi:integrase
MKGSHMAHRPFGSIRTLHSGRYQARYTGPDGRQHSGPTTYVTKADARIWLNDQEVRIRTGQWMNPTAGRITLNTYSAEWLAAKTRLAPSTHAVYENFLRLHILPDLGALRLQDIDRVRVRKWHSQLATKRISANTSAKIYKLLKQIMSTAVDDDLISQNPCRIKGAGQEHVAERSIPGLDDVARIIDAVDPRYRALVAVAAYVGPRFGELAGLQRRHINPLKQEITIEQQLSTVAGKTEIRPPKSKAGYRTVTMPDSVATQISSHLEQFTDPSPEAFVFTTINGSTLDRGNFRQRVWLPVCQEVGVAGIRFHDLRHVAGTHAASSGLSVKALMNHLGHTTVEMALNYMHATQDDEKNIARHINDVING